MLPFWMSPKPDVGQGRFGQRGGDPDQHPPFTQAQAQGDPGDRLRVGVLLRGDAGAGTADRHRPAPGVVLALLLLPIAAAATINASSTRIQNPALIPTAANTFLPTAPPAFLVTPRAAWPATDGAGRSWTSVMWLIPADHRGPAGG